MSMNGPATVNGKGVAPQCTPTTGSRRQPPSPLMATPGTESPNTPGTVLNFTKMFTPMPVVFPSSAISRMRRTSTAGKSIVAPGAAKTALSAILTIVAWAATFVTDPKNTTSKKMMSLGIVVVPPFRTTTNAKDQPNQANTDTTTTRRAWRVWASGGDERVIGAERRHPNHTKNANATTPTTVRNSTIRRRLFSLRTSCRSRSTVPIHWSAGGWVDQASP